MKDKIIAILTLTSVFSLFVYYKINYSQNSGNAQVSEQLLDDNAFNLVDDSNSDVNFNDSDLTIVDEKNKECSMSIDETNTMTFGKAFKYYRECLGSNEVFVWNTNTYSTLRSDEIIIDDSIDDIDNMIVEKNQSIDKQHLVLQNQMFGNKTNK